MEFLKPDEFFDLSSFAHRGLFSGCDYAWEALGRISSYLEEHLRPNVREIACFGSPLPATFILWKGKLFKNGFEILGGDVTKGKFRVKIGDEATNEASVLFEGSVLWDGAIFIGPGAVLEPGALVKGPTIIGMQTEVRQGAYIRGKCIIGDRCVVGHTTEMKSSIMLNDAKAGHFAYIGDSILGNETNLGAGTKLANLKMKGTNIRLPVKGSCIDTGLRKFGAILGDHVEIGCNAVTNPGVVLGKGCLVYPVTAVEPGFYEPKTFVKR